MIRRNTDAEIEDITAVSAFLVYLELDKSFAQFGGRKISQVLNAFCRLVELPPAELRERMLGLHIGKPGDDRHD